mmetsp:Transcript_100678/g.256215  ORF Transcript_100678/g.256215 Transcript_100678/m.256215 type:complete len:209 (+) Transcript_100678:59-685(+)
MGGSGAGKSKGKGKTVAKGSGKTSFTSVKSSISGSKPAPWVKQTTAPAAKPWNSPAASKGSRKGAVASTGASSSKVKGKGKGKGKDKGKKKGPASFDSDFWTRKLEEENRTELEGSYTGTISKYIFKQGWGFIAPHDYESLPATAREALSKAHEDAEAAGKNVSDANWIYFRKPDVDQELYPLKDGMAVNFTVYMDEKGCGACGITAQ